MANIEVNCLVRHLTETGVERSRDEWTALNIVKIAKGESFKGFFNFNIGGRPTKIDQAKAGLCRAEIVRVIADHAKFKFDRPFSVVPVPNSGAHVDTRDDFETLKWARDIASSIGPRATASAALRWASPQLKARDGGRSRNHHLHYQKLRVVEPVGLRVLLFDDVVTSGSQIYASAKRLRDAGATDIHFYCVASVLDRGERGDPYGWRVASRSLMDFGGLF